jgi:LytS/YehU family sensor histidine kinase
LNLFNKGNDVSEVDFIYTSIFIFTIAIVVYINLLILIPRFLNTKKYFTYALSFVILLVLGALFNMFLFSRFIDYILPGFYFISYYSFTDILLFFAVFLILTTLLKLSKEWFQLTEAKQKLTEMEKEKVEIELKALRAQVNPHFLFNSLNVIYSLALKDSKETPEIITRLSDILRYVIYDANVDKVNLSSEVDLINNYLKIQRHRIDSSSQVNFNTDIEEDFQIPPMLLLPMVENSFKHGVKGDLADTFVHIDLRVKQNELRFEIENNKSDSENDKEIRESGIGLENIRHRLEILYPGQHSFEVFENERIFNVKLIIKNEH